MNNYPKKSLGQHFLHSKTALAKIIATATLSSADTVLEIGPGRGALTEKILATGARVIAIEKDEELITHLTSTFHDQITSKHLKIISGDALTFDPNQEPQLKNGYKIVANIPYYITGQFFRLFLQQKNQPSLIVILIQKEVAKRIIAADNKESILSLSIKVYGQPHYEKTVPAGAFSPPPKVDSAILKIDNISKSFFTNKQKSISEMEKEFFTILKRGFSSKRKQLKNNLNLSPEIMTDGHIELKSRAEDLTLSQWQYLVQKLYSN